MQSRTACVKCLADRELSQGRKNILPGNFVLRYEVRIPLLHIGLDDAGPFLCSFRLLHKGGFFMQKFKKRYLESMNELKVTQNLTLCGLMAALAVVLNYTTSFFITPYIRIGFSGYPNRIVEFLFGPYIGALFGGTLDILKYFLKPDGGAFFFGYTFNAMTAGVIYGAILHKKPIKVRRVFVAELLVKLIVNCGLNTLWIALMEGKAFMAILPARMLKNAIQLPVDTALLYFVLTYVMLVLNKSDFRDRRRHRTGEE